jgi:Tol biopolymer transport system component
MRSSLFLIICIGALLSSSSCSIQINQEIPLAPTTSGTGLEAANIPVTWGNLNLTGRLIYVVGYYKGGAGKGGLTMDVRSLDLANGNVKLIFETERGGWIRSVAVAPDLKNLIIAYMPSSEMPPGPRQNLYILPLDGSQPPALLFTPPSDQDQYDQPDWSPDGKYLYFTHINFHSSEPGYEIMRLEYPNGKMESLIKQSYWPRLSADGSQLAYVSIFSANGPNELFIANTDGTDARVVPLSDIEWTNTFIDAPLFLPDGKSILFSGPIRTQSSELNLLERIMDVKVVHAHGSLPSDWWSVSLAGGKPVQLTHIYSPGLFASLSPDSRYIASYSGSGIFVMDPYGQNLTQIVSYTGGLLGTVSWIP